MKGTNLIRAMKSIKKSSLIKEDQQKIFAEMSILKQLDHPNILKLLETYDWKNYYYLITELC
jgi:calcium-dependent protein kinase